MQSTLPPVDGLYYCFRWELGVAGTHVVGSRLFLPAAEVEVVVEAACCGI